MEGDLLGLFSARIREKKSLARLRCCARTQNSKVEAQKAARWGR